MKSPSPKSAAATILKLSPLRPRLAIVLGTGFDFDLPHSEETLEIPYQRIPGFPEVGVSGHAGKLFVGRLEREPVYLLQGRVHFYEGHPMTVVTFAVRALAECGIRDLLLTNAAGGINRGFRAGDFMLVQDHINWMGANPLRGARAADSRRFVDLSEVYDPGLRSLLLRAAKKCRLELKTGVYLAVSGPTYETPAEIRAFERLGADAVGMSTVPEAIAARQCGLNVAAISCITNRAAGRAKGQLDHREVLRRATRMRSMTAKLLTKFIRLYSDRSM